MDTVEKNLYDGEECPEHTDTLTVPPEGAGLRLDRYLSEACRLTRSAATRLIESGMVAMESGEGRSRRAVTPNKNTKLRAGDTLTVTYPEPEDYDVVPENIPLDVLYEDGDILVVNKPVGMVVHPAPGNYTGI